MNQIFEFRKELNIKKILIVLLIIFIITGLILWKVFSPSEESSSVKIKDEVTESKFYSKNKNFSLTLSSSYNFIQFDPAESHILELRNENNLNIFVAEENLLQNLTLAELVEADLKSFVAQFKKSSDISNVTEFDRGGKPAYTYSFPYLDSIAKTAYYLQTIWIEYNDRYYIRSKFINYIKVE